MYFSDSKLWLIYLLWAALIGASVLAFLLLVVTAVRRGGLARWVALALAPTTVAMLFITASFWINAASVHRSSCTMDSLSAALASGVNTPDDRACLNRSRLRVGLSGAVEVVLLSGSAFWMFGRRRPRTRHRADNE